jgi:hypothetical protein
MTMTDSLTVRSFAEPDTLLEPPLARVAATTIGSTTLTRVLAEPGWRWSTSVGPTAGTSSCQLPHTGYLVRGRLHLTMDAGPEVELGPGDVFVCDAGHDAWVVGDEQVELLEVALAQDAS